MSRRQAPTVPVVRCAIYTRKSTEEGLEQAFNTLDAQRESGEAYIKSQQQLGYIEAKRERRKPYRSIAYLAKKPTV